jgi:hypothetical protein
MSPGKMVFGSTRVRAPATFTVAGARSIFCYIWVTGWSSPLALVTPEHEHIAQNPQNVIIGRFVRVLRNVRCTSGWLGGLRTEVMAFVREISSPVRATPRGSRGR